MMFSQVPASAAWRHRDAREGFESVFLRADRPGYRLEGHTAAVEEGQAWAVRYVIALDEHWTTRTARVWGWSLKGEHEVWLEADGSGRWQVNARAAPELDGCLDVDLESSACTNTIPVNRLRLRVGESVEAPAAYVRALDLRVERLEQQYARVDDDGTHQRYDYRCPAFDFECRVVYDDSGLVLEYPGIALRVL
ncbi:MAG: putative glycolipid-binding domain-containing protein [Actinomycetota bacterium]|nr:putative glycolipid-binding domain-containing protein [Actinomycetota bacterium]